jgi:hypothetical protein
VLEHRELANIPPYHGNTPTAEDGLRQVQPGMEILGKWM